MRMLMLFVAAAVVGFALEPSSPCRGAWQAITATVFAQDDGTPSPERSLPEGHTCVDVGRARNGTQHECQCHHECNDEGTLVENGTCLVYCSPANCKCAPRNCP